MKGNNLLFGADQVPMKSWRKVGEDSYVAEHANRTFSLHHDPRCGDLELKVQSNSTDSGARSFSAYNLPRVIQGKPTYPVSRFLDSVRNYVTSPPIKL